MMMWAMLASVALTPTADAGTKRAMLVGAASYPANTGWQQLHADRDVEIVREALERQGFARGDIEVLADPAVGSTRSATRENVLRELQSWAVEPGDHVVFFYSGHGQPITDRSGDEPDGYDESLAMLNAPSSLAVWADYDGGRHLTDDDLGAALAKVRAKLAGKGEVGSLSVIVDAGFSGWATRGSATKGGDALDLKGGRPGAGPGRDSGLADLIAGDAAVPMVVLTATHEGRPAVEAREATEVAGGLTLAVARVLSTEPIGRGKKEAAAVDTWRALYERVAAEMRRSVPEQVPALEGAADSVIFDGTYSAPPQQLRVDISKGDVGRPSVREMVMRAGTVAGLSLGDRLSVYHVETKSKKPPLTRGQITSITPTRAVLRLDAEVAQAHFEETVDARLPEVTPSRTRVRLSMASRPVQRAWEAAVKKLAGVEVLENDDLTPHYVLVERDARVYLVEDAPAKGQVPAQSLATVPVSSSPPPELLWQLGDLARTQLLSGMHASREKSAVRVQALPATWSGEGRGQGDCTVSGEAGPNPVVEAGGAVRLVVTVDSKKPVYGSVLVSGVDGRTVQVHPANGEAAGPIKRGELFAACLEAEPGTRADLQQAWVRAFVGPSPSPVDFWRVFPSLADFARGTTQDPDPQAEGFEQLRALELQLRSDRWAQVPNDVATGSASFSVAKAR